MRCCFPFVKYCCKKKKRCPLCNRIFDANTSDSFCNEKCEILYLYQDSFRSSDSSEHKFIFDI